MSADVLLAMMPSILCHLGGSLLIAIVAWFFIKKAQPNWNFSILAALALGLTFSLYFALNSVMSFSQNRAIISAINEAQNREVPFDKLPPGEAAKRIQELKSLFLTTVENVMADPTQLNPESKAALFKRFQPLFPRRDDQLVYRDAIASVVECQKVFYEDALSSLKAKKSVKSPKREQCQSLDGKFFNRDKLVPQEVAAANDSTIDKLATGKKFMQDGKEVKVDEAFLRQSLDEQAKRLEILNVLFQ